MANNLLLDMQFQIGFFLMNIEILALKTGGCIRQHKSFSWENNCYSCIHDFQLEVYAISCTLKMSAHNIYRPQNQITRHLNKTKLHLSVNCTINLTKEESLEWKVKDLVIKPKQSPTRIWQNWKTNMSRY